jgi:putative ABC transport system permease protein
MHYLKLDYLQVALAALLIVINAAISIALRLKLERSLALASLRTIGQLLRRYPGIWLNTILSVWASAWLVTAFALLVVMHGIERWYQPQYAIPLLGMVLGNTLNGISLGLNTFTDTLATRREQVEMRFALGATRWEAARVPLQQAVRTGMIPIINAMMVVGVVSLPGMMTGQLLSGTPPLEAVKYQIVIMFLIASATALGTVAAVLLSFRRLFSVDHQFRYEEITRVSRE